MYLKKLDIHGFKSFADKISLDFGQGITAIVGPNGSGKSNISDAIRWVLGEQSAKSLRGAKMEDVIFAGTEKRKSQGYAEVSITLDNSTGVFPLAYNEIKVSRKVYRSGESEYTINNAVCRLRDIHELFMDTGLGRDGYSIIGQGRIDEILSTKSEDRRQIFEEAAGISKYRYKKVEAERKLEKTGDNILRITDICGELEGRLASLKTQSEKAKKYLDLREELKGLEVCMMVTAVKNLRLQTAQQQEGYDISARQLLELEAESKRLEAEEEKALAKMSDIDDEITRTRERMHSSEILTTQSEGETTLLKSNIENIELNIERIKNEVEALKKEKEETAEEKSKINKDLVALAEKHNECEARLTKSIENLEKKVSQIDEKNRFISGLNEKALSFVRVAEEIDSKIENIEYTQKNYSEKKARLDEQLSDVEDKLCDYEDRAEKTKKDLADTEKEILNNSQQKEEIILTLKKLSAGIEEKKAEYNRKNSDITFKMSRLNALSDMEKSMDGYGRAVKAVVGGEYTKSGIYGVLSRLINVPAEYATAIDTALGAMLQNVVVEDEQDAKRAIEYLKREKLGRVTFLPVSSVKGNRLSNEREIAGLKGYIGIAADLVQYDRKFENIMANALGRCVVFDNIDNAVSVAKQFGYRFKIVTLAGEVLFPGGSISGGSISENARLLGRSAEIERLREECRLLQNGADKLENEIDDSVDKMHDLQAKLENIRNRENELSGLKISLAADAENTLVMINRENEEKTRIKSELNEMLEFTKTSDGGKLELLQKKQDAEAEYVKASDELDAERRLLRAIMEEKEAVSADIINLRLELNSAEKDAESLKASVSDIEARCAEIDRITGAKKNDIDSLYKDIENVNFKIRDKLLNIEAAKNRFEEFQGEIVLLQEKRKTLDSEAAVLKEQSRIKIDEIVQKKEECARGELRLERDREAIDINIAKLWDEYELTFTEALKYEFEIENKSAAKNKVSGLKNQIRSLGSINVDAIEEYKEVSSRYGFMSEQLSDLEKAKEELEKLIVEVTKVMTAKFKEQFAIINEKFAETFSELFGGGTAKLELTMPEKVLESGIEITAQPTGKKLQSLTLLSGGEKALTAIALLLAILKVRPTPFCILDEIDAALDENNVGRFSDFIKKLCNNTQFIVVTHRRGTMEAADILYGVAMQEKGVSKLLSMALDDSVK